MRLVHGFLELDSRGDNGNADRNIVRESLDHAVSIAWRQSPSTLHPTKNLTRQTASIPF